MLSIFVLTFMLTEFCIQHIVCFKDKSTRKTQKPSHSRISRIDFSKQSSDGFGYDYIKIEFEMRKEKYFTYNLNASFSVQSSLL